MIQLRLSAVGLGLIPMHKPNQFSLFPGLDAAADAAKEAEFYPTLEGWTVRALIEAADPPLRFGHVAEHAAGEGHLVRHVVAVVPEAKRWTLIELRADAAERAGAVVGELGLSGLVLVGDFLAGCGGDLSGVTLAITNPPFSLAARFLAESVRRMPGADVALLVRQGFFASRERREILRDLPIDRYDLAERPSFGGGGTDLYDYCWIVAGPERGGRWYSIGRDPVSPAACGQCGASVRGACGVVLDGGRCALPRGHRPLGGVGHWGLCVACAVAEVELRAPVEPADLAEADTRAAHVGTRIHGTFEQSSHDENRAADARFSPRGTEEAKQLRGGERPNGEVREVRISLWEQRGTGVLLPRETVGPESIGVPGPEWRNASMAANEQTPTIGAEKHRLAGGMSNRSYETHTATTAEETAPHVEAWEQRGTVNEQTQGEGERPSSGAAVQGVNESIRGNDGAERAPAAVEGSEVEYRLSFAQRGALQTLLRSGGGGYLTGTSVRVGRRLVRDGFVSMRDGGKGPGKERWWFDLTEKGRLDAEAYKRRRAEREGQGHGDSPLSLTVLQRELIQSLRYAGRALEESELPRAGRLRDAGLVILTAHNGSGWWAQLTERGARDAEVFEAKERGES